MQAAAGAAGAEGGAEGAEGAEGSAVTPESRRAPGRIVPPAGGAAGVTRVGFSALLLALSFPPLHLVVPPFVALVPFALLLHALPADAGGRRAAAEAGALLGALCFAALLHWIPIALIGLTPLALPVFLGALGLVALLGAFTGWAYHRLVHEAMLPAWLALPLAWTSAEWLQAHAGDLSIPWLGLGSSLTGRPELVGIAELVGARGATFWLALANGLVVTTLLRRRRRPHGARLPAAACVAVILLPMAWGVWRAETLDLRPVARVAVVQPSLPVGAARAPAASTAAAFRALEGVTPRVERPVDLVVLPEVVFPRFVRADEGAPVRERVTALAAEAGSPVLFGGWGHRDEEDGGRAVFNSAFVATFEGLADWEYAKRDLVPFVERLPFLPARAAGGPRGDGQGGGWAYAVPEGRRPLLELSGVRYGVLICFESIFARASRELRRAGADVLVNITNDGWYDRTVALHQHPAHMVMRAIENRVGVARAANTGLSHFVDPVGRVHDPAPPLEPSVRHATVLTTDVVTLYARLGDVVGTGAVLATLLLLLAPALRRGRGAGPLREDGAA